MELHKQAIEKRLKEVAEKEEEWGPEITRQKKKSIQHMLSKLVPGNTTGIAAMRDEDGRVKASPEEMADILRRHWSPIFTAKDSDAKKRKEWLEEEIKEMRKEEQGDLQHVAMESWMVSRKEIEKAIKHAPRSAVGPDGIPFEAWRLISNLGIEVLTGVARSLMKDDAKEEMRKANGEDDAEDHHFNE